MIKATVVVIYQIKTPVRQILFIFVLPAPKIEKINDHVCEITWECLQPMKGDPVIYSLQVMMGKDSEFKQVCAKI